MTRQLNVRGVLFVTWLHRLEFALCLAPACLLNRGNGAAFHFLSAARVLISSDPVNLSIATAAG